MSRKVKVDPDDTWGAIRAILKSCEAARPDEVVTHMTADVFAAILRGLVEVKDALAKPEVEEKA